MQSDRDAATKCFTSFFSPFVIQKIFGKGGGNLMFFQKLNEENNTHKWNVGGTAIKRAEEGSIMCLSVLGQHFQTPPQPHVPMKKKKNENNDSKKNKSKQL